MHSSEPDVIQDMLSSSFFTPLEPNYWQLAILAFRFAFSRLRSSGFAYGWSEANPDSEQTVPACAAHIGTALWAWSKSKTADCCELTCWVCWRTHDALVKIWLATAVFYLCRGKQSFPLQPPTHLIYNSTWLPGGFSPLAYNNLGETKCCCKIQKTHLVSPQPAFYITDFVLQHIGFIQQRGLTFACL